MTRYLIYGCLLFFGVTIIKHNHYTGTAFSNGPVGYGKKSKSYANATIKPITGDGGAKLQLSEEKYLYYKLSEYSRKNILDNWARVFR